MNQQSLSQQYPQYYKDVSSLTEVDVYQVHSLFGITDHSGAIHHASKKLLLAGVRTGGKPALEDIREARDTLTRYLQINSVAALLQQPKVFPEPANEPVAVVKEGPVLKRFVVLYYHQYADRRFKPLQYYTMAFSLAQAVEHFRSDYPKSAAVCTEQVAFFIPDGDRLSKRWWNNR